MWWLDLDDVTLNGPWWIGCDDGAGAVWQSGLQSGPQRRLGCGLRCGFNAGNKVRYVHDYSYSWCTLCPPSADHARGRRAIPASGASMWAPKQAGYMLYSGLTMCCAAGNKVGCGGCSDADCEVSSVVTKWAAKWISVVSEASPVMSGLRCGLQRGLWTSKSHLSIVWWKMGPMGARIWL